MNIDTGDLALLRLEAQTLFSLDTRSRIVHVNSPDNGPAPRLYLAGCASGNILYLRNDVGDETAATIARLAAEEPPLSEPASNALHIDQYRQLLGAGDSPTESWPGLIWTVPSERAFAHAARLIRSDTSAGDDLLARLRADGMSSALIDMGFTALSEFWPPWCVAMDGGDIASIAFTVAQNEKAAEAGLATMPAFRGRGLGAAATAGWASHPELGARALFYSTSRANTSSQRVVERLQLRFLGASLRIT